MLFLALFHLLLHVLPVTPYKYDPAYTGFNLNQNQTAVHPLDFWGEWTGHNYTSSPENWRFPFYTLFLDRFVNGDPYNDDHNGTAFERVTDSNQMRHGGDLQGLLDTLDYIQGMGIKGLYIAGSPFLNQPWQYDSYSPLDLTLLDGHYGTIDMWRVAVDEIHARGMYVILDNTFATLGDLIGFDGYLNESTPFTLKEHKVMWKSDRHYWDFSIGDSYNSTCAYPRFWNETGYRIDEDIADQMNGCYDSDFDQYGDTEAFGVYPDYRRQLSKFASVQDRLREWHPEVRAKLENFYCMAIAQLDVDGFRYDKAVQSTVDAMGAMSEATRVCARRYNKANFFIPGEITGGNALGSIYIGRGRQPDMLPDNITQAVELTSNSSSKYFIRDADAAAIDAAAFHYTTYRSMTRFLGMDGNLEAGYDAPRNWVDQWNTLMMTNDLVNANSGSFDPRHMYGTTNQDVFRWPAIERGVERQLLSHFITTLLMPGIPLMLWGEEQTFYVLDSTNDNYIFGRMPMSTATAWQTHGCYSLDSTQYYNMPWDAARRGCHDDKISLDHRDPSAPVRNILKRMFDLRRSFPVLQDGFFLQQLSNQTWEVLYPGSSGVATETGLWSVLRNGYPGVQSLTNEPITNDTVPQHAFSGLNSLSNLTQSAAVQPEPASPVWLVYTNLNASKTYLFDCSDNATDLNSTSMMAPFPHGTTVKNLLPPYQEHTLVSSTRALGISNSSENNGCLESLKMMAYDYRAYVPIDLWTGPKPMITHFSPGHDARIVSKSADISATEDLEVRLEFSTAMECENVTSSITFTSKTDSGAYPYIDLNSVECSQVDQQESNLVGEVISAWAWSATIKGLAHGVHRMTVDHPKAATASQRDSTTGARDHFLFRVGQANNPIVFTRSANYSSTLLGNAHHGRLLLNHSAAGADLYRYSLDFGDTFTEWTPYLGGAEEISAHSQSNKKKTWQGEHVRVEYFSRLGGSSSHVQQGDTKSKARRFPHLYLNGVWNSYGFDQGLNNKFELTADYTWEKTWMTEWSNNGSVAQINVWGIGPDGRPDQTVVFGDVDGDSVLDRLPPSALAPVILNVTAPPPKPFLSWRFTVNDGDLHFQLQPAGSMWHQLALYIILWVAPLILAALSVWIYTRSFYKIKFNKIGVTQKLGLLGLLPSSAQKHFTTKPREEKLSMLGKMKRSSQVFSTSISKAEAMVVLSLPETRRTVLIATMEYDIEDWAIKIKIGGLGVMAQLMGKNLEHQDLVWVVPCAGGIEYPQDEVAKPMTVAVLGKTYEVNVQYHKLRNITYVLLDAPIFRQQTAAEPYPARMDDLDSAIYYSAWNQCIAQALVRFEVDLYHINDYHGTVAPLYLLPRTVPVALSLHNAEFQGLWPMRTRKERDEVCSVFNLPPDLVSEYVQFGEIFNLLHAGASYLRIHQEGFGAVGVSKKYGARAYTRYPIFWGLKEVQALQNPDPSDTAAWDKKLLHEHDAPVIDEEFERKRLTWRLQAQEWANLEKNVNAELFVFVGRWSQQKGVDLIADAFPAILESHPNAQLIAVGPVIDLYGKFAALKLDRLMKLYPNRVCSKPVFTSLPPFVFSGAEFALIPSRDEPFGLVAVEFGRKGALGVGARVGGLGQMPGWWYTVESTTTNHLLSQFKDAIRGALSSSTKTRATMRARSAKQRFPVAQWVEELELLQSTAIRIHDRVVFERNKWSTVTLVHPHPSIHPTLVTAKRAAPRVSVYGPGHDPDPQAESGTVTPKHRLAPRTSLLVRELRNVRLSGSHESTAGDDDITACSDDENVSSLTGGQSTPWPLSPTSPISTPYESSTAALTPRSPRTPAGPRDDSIPPVPPLPAEELRRRLRPLSNLSMINIVGEKNDYSLQKVSPFFTDKSGHFYQKFEKKIETLDGKNSETTHCIEDFLVRSEKEWFDDFRNAKLGLRKRDSHSTLATTTRTGRSRPVSMVPSEAPTTFPQSSPDEEEHGDAPHDDFMLGDAYQPPRGLRKWMQVKLGYWPLYAYFLALGQIIAANSYQMVLLTGEVGQSAAKLYTVASIYLAASVLWWYLFRRFASFVSLSLPFAFYGLAFFLVGLAPFLPSYAARGWTQNVATASYTIASASGSLFFSLNFGDEGAAPVSTWVLRACVIQGLQQLYTVALWFWGSFLAARARLGLPPTTTAAGTWKIAAGTLPLAAALWIIAAVMWSGLPPYYRQTPGHMPSFYRSIARRKVILWFFVTAAVQNFFLSAPAGRNWSFLFHSAHASPTQILGLVALFFGAVWAALCLLFARLSRAHSWILPLFALGLGAPRWAQIWWGTSAVALWLPWAPGSVADGSVYVAAALLARALWLWLGVLDAVQAVGLGMVLLGTLTRTHVAFAGVAMQVVGSLATMLGRAVGPNRVGPGPISPDISGGIAGLGQAWFWVGLGANLGLCVGFYRFYRKEQLMKP